MGGSDSTNVLSLVKEGEGYLFLYDDASVPELLRSFGRMAVDSELNFGWLDAAILSQRVRRLQKHHQQ